MLSTDTDSKKWKSTAGGAGRYVPLAKYADLTDGDVCVVDVLLGQGRPIKEVVGLLQEEMGRCPNVQPATLERKLYRYRDGEYREHLAVQYARAFEPEEHKPLLAKLEQRLDYLALMEAAVRRQVARCEKLQAIEDRLPGVLNVLTENEALLVRMINWVLLRQMDLGIVKRVPRPRAPTPEEVVRAEWLKRELDNQRSAELRRKFRDGKLNVTPEMQEAAHRVLDVIHKVTKGGTVIN